MLLGPATVSTLMFMDFICKNVGHLGSLEEESLGFCLSSLATKQKEKLFNDLAPRLFPCFPMCQSY